jgi:hypothetical protein
MIYYFINKLKKILPFILFFIFFLSINSEPWKINIFLDQISIKDHINYFRGILPIISGFLILGYLILNKKIFERLDIIAIVFFLYFLLQLSGLLINFPINQEDNFNYRIYFLLLLLFSIFLFLYMKENYLNKILLSMIILILLINLYFVSVSTYEFYTNKLPFYYLKIFQANTTILDSPSIRSTGLARINLVLFIFAIIYLEKIKNNYFIALIIINLLLILLLQSRLNIYSFYFFLIFYLLFFKNLKTKERIKFFIIFSVIPLLIYHSIKFDKSESTEGIKKNIENNIIFNSEKHKTLYNFSTGRILIWKDLLNKPKTLKQIAFGFGSQADRILTTPSFFSASNAYVYILICSGILGLIIIISLIYYILVRIIKLIFINKIFSKNGNIFLKFSILIFIYFLFRSLVESSFAIYGIDYLFFVLSSKIILLNKFLGK